MALDCAKFVIVNMTTNTTTDYKPPTPEETGTASEWLFGMAFTILSAFAVSLGTVLQKKAHVEDLRKPPAERAPRKAGMLYSRTWLCGFFMMVLLQVPLTFAALALAPQSLVIPLPLVGQK